MCRCQDPSLGWTRVWARSESWDEHGPAFARQGPTRRREDSPRKERRRRKRRGGGGEEDKDRCGGCQLQAPRWRGLGRRNPQLHGQRPTERSDVSLGRVPRQCPCFS